MKIDWKTAYLIVAVALASGTGLFVFFGWLSDRIGRKKIMMAGCLFGALTYFPIFKAMTHFGNPALETFTANTHISVDREQLPVHLFPNPKTVYSDCDKTLDYLSKRSLSYETSEGAPGAKPIVNINDVVIDGLGRAEAHAPRSRPLAIRRPPRRTTSTFPC